jgi:DNA-binding NarL/FixJ family response regulator
VVEVVGLAGSDDETRRLVDERRPRIVVLDMAMPQSRETVQWIRATEHAAVVALGLQDDETEVLFCARAGVTALVPRDGSLEDLLTVFESAARGDFHCAPRIANALLRALTALGDPVTPTSPLTSREREVADLIDRGFSNKDIARELHIEVATVKNHVHRVLEKLGVHRRAQAAARIRARYPLRRSAS